MEIYVKCEYHNSVDKIGYLLSDAGTNVYPYAKKIKIDLYLMLYTKVNIIWINFKTFRRIFRIQCNFSVRNKSLSHRKQTQKEITDKLYHF